MLIMIILMVFLAIAIGSISVVSKKTGGHPRFGRRKYPAKPMLSKWERNVLPRLVATAPAGIHICPQVRLAELIRVTRNEDPSTFEKVAKKSVDFVVCDTETGIPILVIELNDSSHNRPDRMERDRFVGQLLEDAGIGLYTMKPSERTPDVRTLLQQLQTARKYRS